MGDTKKHAVLGPSGAETWMNCPGSVEAQRGIPNRSSIHSRYGTAMHDIAERCLVYKQDAEEYLGEMAGDPGEEVEVDMEMCDAVNAYISYVYTFLDPETDIIHAEQAVPLQHLTGEEDAEGTSDVIGITRDGKRLVVVDLKGGKGVQVYAKSDSGEPNKQMAIYALGALRNFEAFYDFDDVQMVIIQPRRDWVDDHVMTIDELRAFGEKVSIAAGRTQIGNAELVPTTKGCQWCRAKPTCPALRDEVFAAVTVSTADSFAALDVDALPKTLAAQIKTPDDDAALAASWRSIKLVESWIAAVKEEVERRTRSDEGMPGFKEVDGQQGNRKWADEDAAFVELKKRKKLDEIAVIKPISPTQAEKVFKAQPKIWAKIAPMITRAPAGSIVVQESDPRPARQRVSASTSFENSAAETPQEELTVSEKPAISEALSSMLD